MENLPLYNEEVTIKNPSEIIKAEKKIDTIVTKKHNLKKDWSTNVNSLGR